MDEKSGITYSNVNSITFQGTHAENNTAVYNNVEDIWKEEALQ